LSGIGRWCDFAVAALDHRSLLSLMSHLFDAGATIRPRKDFGAMQYHILESVLKGW
jgi:hypothetical protein